MERGRDGIAGPNAVAGFIPVVGSLWFAVHDFSMIGYDWDNGSWADIGGDIAGGIGNIAFAGADFLSFGGAGLLKSGAKSLARSGVESLVREEAVAAGGAALRQRGVRSAIGMTTDFAGEAGEVGARLYGAERLKTLGRYLGRRGVKLEVGSTALPFGKAGAFLANPDGSARLLLKADPTNQLVWHELGHFIQWRRIGSEAYRALPRTTAFHAPEQFVFDLLEHPNRWYRLSPEYRIHSAEYIEAVGGFR